jgi:hypothetical protein
MSTEPIGSSQPVYSGPNPGGITPYAAVCRRGHVVGWFVYLFKPHPHCKDCGDDVLTACENPDCNAPLIAYQCGGIPEDEKYHSNCIMCGTPYPWTVAARAKADRLLAMQADIDDWDEATKEVAREFVEELMSGTATEASATTSIRWIEQRIGKPAGKALYDIAISVAADMTKKVLGMGP